MQQMQMNALNAGPWLGSPGDTAGLREVSHMIRNSNRGRGVVHYGLRSLCLASVAMLALAAAPDRRAEAMSLINPGAAPAAKHATDGLAIEIRGHGGHGGGGFHGGHGGGFRGGGAAIHGGGFGSGGAVFHGGVYRAGPVFRGSGIRYGGYRFAHRHRAHRGFFLGPSYYYDYSYYYPYRRCRIVWTYDGPRRVCHVRHWHRYWRHHHRRYHRTHW